MQHHPRARYNFFCGESLSANYSSMLVLGKLEGLMYMKGELTWSDLYPEVRDHFFPCVPISGLKLLFYVSPKVLCSYFLLIFV